jgi:hypothetical protein
MFCYGNFREISFLTLPKYTNRHRSALGYANLPAKRTDYAYSFNNSGFHNFIRSDSLNRKYSWELLSCRLYLRHSVICFLGVFQQRKKKLEDQYLEHSRDLVELVFKEWLNREWDLVTNELFPEACEHLRSGYPSVLELWEKFKELSKECETLRSRIRVKIEKKIKDLILNKLPDVKLGERTLSLLVTDVKDYVDRKIEDGYPLFYFDTEYLTEPKLYKLVTMRKEGDYYRNDYNVQISSKADIKSIVKILSSVLEDAEIKEKIQLLRAKIRDERTTLEHFRKELKSIINTFRFEFKGIKGKCRICIDWKP